VVISLVVSALTGWASSRIEVEKRLTRLEADVEWIRDAVARIENNLKEK